MKAGLTVQQLAESVVKSAQSKKDYVADTRALTMVQRDDGVALAFQVKGENRLFAPSKTCLDQIAGRVDIPAKYAERMRNEAPDLLCQNVNHWFAKKPERRMLRTFDNGEKIARAFLSDGYRPFDNIDLCAAILPKLEKAGCIVRSAQVTETRLYIQASTPQIESVIEQNVKRGTHNRIQRTVQAGVAIGNSEVGFGSLFVDPLAYDLVCTNGLITARSLRRNHVGRRHEGTIFGDENTFEVFSDETRKQDDKAFWMKVCDVVDAALDRVKFEERMARLRAAQNVELCANNTEVPAVVDRVTEVLQLNDSEKANLLMHFVQDGDFSQYGLLNAVTRTAEDCESYDRAVEMERMGGAVLEMPASQFSAN